MLAYSPALVVRDGFLSCLAHLLVCGLFSRIWGSAFARWADRLARASGRFARGTYSYDGLNPVCSVCAGWLCAHASCYARGACMGSPRLAHALLLHGWLMPRRSARTPSARVRIAEKCTQCFLLRAVAKCRASSSRFPASRRGKHCVSQCFLFALRAKRRVLRCFLCATTAEQLYVFREVYCCPWLGWAAGGLRGRFCRMHGTADAAQPLRSARAPSARARILCETRCFLSPAFAKRRVSRGFL